MSDTGSIRPLQRILYLKRYPAFTTLPAPALAALAQQTRERFFAKGAVLLRDDEPIPAIHFVVDGRVRLKRGDRDLGSAGTGLALGSLEVFARDEHGLLAIAETETLTLELESEAFLEVCEEHFTILLHALRYTSRLLIELNESLWSQLAERQPGRNVPGLGQELDFVERIFVLRGLAPFARTSINTLTELSRGLTEVRFDAGIPLWNEGDAAPYVLLMANGMVRCSSSARPDPLLIGPGSALGALEAVAEEPRWFAAVTETPVVALHGTAEGLIDVFEDNLEMAMDYLAFLARMVTSLLERWPPGEGPSPAARTPE